MEGESIQCPSCGRYILIPLSQDKFMATVKTMVQQETSLEKPVMEPAYLPAENEPYTRPENSGLAIASLVVGIAGLIFGVLCLGAILPVIAIILGHIAYVQIKRRPSKLRGKSYAVAGFTAGYVGLVVIVVMNFYLHQVTTDLNNVTDELYRSMGMTPPKHE